MADFIAQRRKGGNHADRLQRAHIRPVDRRWALVWVGAGRYLGVSAVDVRLFGYGPNQSVDATIDSMRRFRDGGLTYV
jgi:hypothetical protein